MSDATVHAYGPHPAQFVELRRPVGQPVGTAVLIHGGYWRDRYGLDLMDPMADHLVEDGWAVANIEYRRLAEPKTPPTSEPDGGLWPAISADVLAALGALDTLDALRALGGRPEPAPLAGRGMLARPVVAIGHSAGGHLGLWAGAVSSRLDAVVALAPVADLIAADRLSLSDGVVRRLLGADSATRPHLYRAASPRALLPSAWPS